MGRGGGGEDCAWRSRWVAGSYGVLVKRVRVHHTPHTRRAGATGCAQGAIAPETQRRG